MSFLTSHQLGVRFIAQLQYSVVISLDFEGVRVCSWSIGDDSIFERLKRTLCMAKDVGFPDFLGIKISYSPSVIESCSLIVHLDDRK
jgi:hypothetical protein